jgi:nucleoid DNA-binding protein
MINYIIKALLNDNSIFINDLGTFTKQYQSARFDGDTILPPQYIVNLTVKDDQPDGTEFINLLCREKQCRITEAAAEISHWVEELKTALENNKSVSFDNFGTFSLSDKGVIQFVCDNIDEINREFEGMGVGRLGEVGIGSEMEEERIRGEEEQRMREEEERRVREAEEKRLQEEEEQRRREEEERRAHEAEEKRLQEEAEQRLREAEEQERLAKEAEERRLQEEAEQRLREAEENVNTEEEIQEAHMVQEVQDVKVVHESTDTDGDNGDGNIPTEEKKKHRSLWWLFVLLILIALGVLGYLFRQQLLTVFNNLKEKITAPKEAVVTEEPETVAEDTIAYDETVAEDTVSEPEVYTPEVVRNTANGNYPVIRFEQGHYYVIAGSLPSEQDAVRHIKQRNLDQYEPKLVTQSGVSNLRVCIGIFDTEEEAESFAKNVNPKYWVLK